MTYFLCLFLIIILAMFSGVQFYTIFNEHVQWLCLDLYHLL
jgi:hypothetical protein